MGNEGAKCSGDLACDSGNSLACADIWDMTDPKANKTLGTKCMASTSCDKADKDDATKYY